MRPLKQITAVAALALTPFATMGVTTASATSLPNEITIQKTCEDDYDIETSGARAGASLWCLDGKIHIDGWVKDTEKDGECADVYGRVGDNKYRSPMACPKGDKKWFSYSGKGKTATATLREF